MGLQRLSLSPTKIQIKDPKHWNSVIKHQANLKNDQAILSAYTQMESLGVLPNNTTLPLVLKACAAQNAVERGKSIHRSIQGTDLMDDVRVGTAVVDFYCKCGFVEDARCVFDAMSDRDVVLWNAMVYGYVGWGYYEEAMLLVREMGRENLRPNSRTMVALLLACEGASELRLGRGVHGYCLRNGMFDSNPHVATALIGFYLRFDMRVLPLLFDLMVVRNIVSWNAMISGYYDVGDYFKALELFVQMLVDEVKFDCVTMLVAVQACAELGSLKLGKQIHQLAIKFEFVEDLYILNALLNMYSNNGSLESSHQLFESVPNRDAPLWNSMISAYAAFGCHEEAMDLFIRMQSEGVKKDERTVVIMLSMCEELASGLLKGKSLHAHVIKSGMRIDASLGNALLSMYTELNCVESVQKIFDRMKGVDIISWNTMILALARNTLRAQACELFERMRESEIKPNSYTIISILAACEDVTCLDFGRSIHGYVMKHSIEINQPLRTALADMYMNCGDEATARDLFEGCPDRDLISWNAMIASYVKNNQAHKALLLFHHMISEAEPNSVTIINVLSSFTHLATLPQGQSLHAYVTRRGFSLGLDLSLANAFITMYARCGSLQSAENIFKTLPKRNIISWNAMIAGYGMNGRGSDAMLAFSQMLEDGFRPNGVTFVSVLSACSHSGFIEMGLQLFHSMVQDFNVTPELVHYSCIVDLLARGGCIDEAREFIDSMPVEPDASVWRALLSSCRAYSDAKQAKTIFEKLDKLEPMNAGNYVLLSNVYATAGLWLEVRRIRTWLKEKGLRKPPGISWIIVKNQVHCFSAGDRSHRQSDKIYAKLSILLSSMRETGYDPDLQWVFHEEDD